MNFRSILLPARWGLRRVRAGISPGSARPRLLNGSLLVCVGLGVAALAGIAYVVVDASTRSARADAYVTGEKPVEDGYDVTYMWWPSEADGLPNGSTGLPGRTHRSIEHDWAADSFVCYEPGKLGNSRLARSGWSGCGLASGNMTATAAVAVAIILLMSGLVSRRWWRLRHPDRYSSPDVPAVEFLGTSWYARGWPYMARRMTMLAAQLVVGLPTALIMPALVATAMGYHGLPGLLIAGPIAAAGYLCLVLMWRWSMRGDLSVFAAAWNGSSGRHPVVPGRSALLSIARIWIYMFWGGWLLDISRSCGRTVPDERPLLEIYGTARQPKIPIDWLPPR